MSQQEFERTDKEVMDLVNGAASPQSKKTAAAIEKELTQKEVPTSRCDNDECAEECVSRVVVEEMHRKWRRNEVITHSLAALAGIAAAVAMVIALKKPECLVYITNAICLIGGVVAAFQIEKVVKLVKE